MNGDCMSDVFKWLLLYPLVLLFALIAFFLVALGVTEANKAYWDSKVRKWCEEDGGVTVFEKVVLTPEEFKRNIGPSGNFLVPPEQYRDANKYDYFYRTDISVIRKSNPSIKRLESVTYRKSDNKNIGKLVMYSRSGGDLFYIDVSSSFNCSDIAGIEMVSASKKIFSVKEE